MCPRKQSSSLVMRHARQDDVASVLECLAQAFEPYRESYTPEGFADTVLTRETLLQRMDSMTILVAVSAAGQGEIIGTIGCGVVNSHEGHLRGMAVAPEWQGSGVAEQLLKSAEAELRSHQCSRITLDTTLPLKKAMRFYEKQGYRRSGKKQDFFGMPLVEYVKEI